MTNQDIDSAGGLWFYTSTHTDLWENIAARPYVNVSYVQPEASLYVSVSGTAERVVDRARIRELWNPMAAAWFAHGVDDPHLVLVRVAARTAEYWDANSSTMVGLFDLARAALAGSPPEVEADEHGKIKL
jgi:general stress protein 26